MEQSIEEPRGDRAVAEAIRGGDEAAFVGFASRHQGCLMRLARAWVHDRALAEDIVQETWMTVLESIGQFEGRSSLKTWVCGMLVNTARARLRKEGRTIPMSSLGLEVDEPAVDPSRFSPPGVPWEGHWWPPPTPFPDDPERRALNVELRGRLEAAIADLPAPQRSVIVLRDVEGLTGEEVCSVLGLSDTNQRVLLHRARAKLRAVLEREYEGSAS